MEWPRIPLPGWPDGDAPGAADELRASAARGRELAALLDPETPVPGVTAGTLRPELAAIAVPSTADGHNMAGDDFALTAGWGHFGTDDAVMPGAGRSVERDYSATRATRPWVTPPAFSDDSTLDIHLNDNARWSNVPAAVWNYKLGGYQVLKKWLSYREHKVLGRNMHPDEVRHFTRHRPAHSRDPDAHGTGMTPSHRSHASTPGKGTHQSRLRDGVCTLCRHGVPPETGR